MRLKTWLRAKERNSEKADRFSQVNAFGETSKSGSGKGSGNKEHPVALSASNGLVEIQRVL
jgi:hypothetical protein